MSPAQALATDYDNARIEAMMLDMAREVEAEIPSCSDLFWVTAVIRVGGKLIRQPLAVRAEVPDFLVKGEVHRLLFRVLDGLAYKLVSIEQPYCPF